MYNGFMSLMIDGYTLEIYIDAELRSYSRINSSEYFKTNLALSKNMKDYIII
jgi:hypothetical protein